MARKTRTVGCADGDAGAGAGEDTLPLRVARSGTKLPAAQWQFIGKPLLSLRGWKLRTGGSSRSSPAPALASPSSLCLERVSLGLLCRHKHGLGKTGRRYSWDRWCTALVSWETVLRVKLLSGLQRSCGRLLRRCGSRCVRRSSWRWHRRCSC